MTAFEPDLVSTIIPVYNRPGMIQEAVQSVLQQTHAAREIIVVDDGSTDDTPRIVEQLARQHAPLIQFIRKENSGPGPSREAGRQLARGEFIQYLDSDDLLRPRKFEWQVQALRDRPECGAAYGYICVHPAGQPPKTKPFKGSGETRETLFPWLLADRWWNTDAPLFRRSVCDAVGPWSDLRWSQDWEYDGRVAALGTRLAHVREWVCDERHHGGERQTSPANWQTPVRLRSRLRFLQLMLGHAERAGVPAASPHRVHFTRWVFATARECAASGLKDEAWQCLALARQSAGTCQEAMSGMTAFQSMARLLGLANAGRVSRFLQRLRRPGKMTMQQSFARDLS